MDKSALKHSQRRRRKAGIRKRVFGTPQRPRLTVFRSNQYIYAQVIDDVAHKTLAAAASSSAQKGSNCDAAAEVGRELAEKATVAGVTAVAFDRNGYQYHGRVKALAEAARKGGLKF